MKKFLSLLAALLVMAAVIPGASAAEASANGKIVILVSNNPADLAIANDLQIMIGDNAIIIQTDWGVYDDAVLQQIEDLNPSEVIIIGGNAAVPGTYSAALQSDGYAVVRLGGCNQYATLKKAIDWAVQNGYSYHGEIYIANGADYAEIQELSSQGYFVVFDNTHFGLTVQIVEELHPQSVQIDPQLKEEANKINIKIPVQELNKKALAEKIIAHVRVLTNSENQTQRAKALIELSTLNKLMAQGKINVIFQLHAADSVSKVFDNAAHIEKLRHQNEYMLQLHEFVKELKKSGKFKEYRQSVMQVKMLIKEGKYDEAMKLMQQIEEQAGISTATSSASSMMSSMTSSASSMISSMTNGMPVSTTTTKEKGGKP